MKHIEKYPRTYHLAFSEGCTNDDKMLNDNNIFLNNNIVITSKLDGSNFGFTNSECFARSHNGPPTHKSFDWAKSYHNQIKYMVPEGLVVYAEYLFAKHSIHYTCLPNYICIFNVLDMNTDEWLSWDDVEGISAILNIPTVPLLFDGVFKTNKELEIKCSLLMKEKEFLADEREGIVIRLKQSFKNCDFGKSVAKAVRPSHVQTDEHWSHQEIIKNKVKI